MTTIPNNDEKMHPCFIETPKPNAIMAIKTNDGVRYLLPNHHFLGGEYRKKADTETETLTLDYVLHVVHIEGVNLAPIVTAIQGMKARFVKPEPKPASTPKSESRVTSIDVAYKHDE